MEKDKEQEKEYDQEVEGQHWGGGQLQVLKRMQEECNWGMTNKFDQCKPAHIISPPVSQ